MAPNYRGKQYSQRFVELKTLLGADLATYILCAFCDLPYDNSIMAGAWEDYIDDIEPKDGEIERSFRDGQTSVEVALLNGTSSMERWQTVWGEGDPNKPYTAQDYKRMDELFRTYSARLVSSGGYDAQQEDTLRSCCKMRLLADKALASGTKDGVAMNTQLNKTIQEQLASENLRRKDAKPIETARIDGIVDALRKKYGVSVELSYDEAVEVCCKWLKNKRQPMTMDAAEQALLAIIRTMQINNDLPEIDELPEQARFSPELNTEFAPVPNDMERDAYDYLGLKHRNGGGSHGRSR